MRGRIWLGLLPKVIRAGAGPHDLGSGDNRGDTYPELTVQLDTEEPTSDDDDLAREWYQTADGSGSDQEVVVRNTPDDEAHSNWDVVADYVFQNSGATSVLMHHRDLVQFGAIRRGDAGGLHALLTKHRPRVVVDANGVGRIVWEEIYQPEATSGISIATPVVDHQCIPVRTGQGVSESEHPLQQLNDLDKASPDFYAQLHDFLRGDAYRSVFSELQNGDSLWLAECLDNALEGMLDRTSLIFLEVLHELRRISGIKGVVPRSCMLSQSLVVLGGGGTYNGSKVCIKRVKFCPGTSTQKVKEVVTVSRHLAHPNVVRLLGVTPDPLNLVFDWMPGGDMPTYIMNHPDTDRHSLLFDVANGLQYLHSCDIIHGNLKGSNVLIDATSHARITNFGFAVVTQDLVSMRAASTDESNAVRWIAPEILDGQGTYSKEADVFSFAGVIIEAFTGAAPFSERPLHDATSAIIRGERPAPPTHKFMVDKLWALTQQCWGREVRLRPTALQILCNLPSGIPMWRHLISGHFLTEGRIALTTAIYTNCNETEAVRRLDGKDAQTFVDIVDQTRDDLIPEIRGKCLATLSEICGRQRLLPESVRVLPCHILEGTVQCPGAYADVWKGKYKGREVAVRVLKVPSPLEFNQDNIASRFCREVMTWKALRHPNVLPLLGATIGDNQFSIVTEWMANGNINNFVTVHGNVDRFGLLKDVVRGVIYIHDKGIIHGDLKGTHILISNYGRALLADFSLATTITDSAESSDFDAPTCGIIRCGTIRWIGPELLNLHRWAMGGRPTKESDCYSLGMVMFEVLAGEAPFAGCNDIAVIKMVLEGKCPERPGGPWFTGDLWANLEQCWSPQPERRPTAEAVLKCLEKVSVGQGPLPPGPDNVQVDVEAHPNIEEQDKGGK